MIAIVLFKSLTYTFILPDVLLIADLTTPSLPLYSAPVTRSFKMTGVPKGSDSLVDIVYPAIDNFVRGTISLSVLASLIARLAAARVPDLILASVCHLSISTL